MYGVSKNTRKYMDRQMGAFLRQYTRKAYPGRDPNDRGYDRAIEQYIRRLRPRDLDVLLHGDEDERLAQPGEAQAGL